MANVKVVNMAGKEVGSIELLDSIFAVEVNPAVLHSAVRAYLLNQRQGTQSTLTRTEVSGGGKKPWRQKGTGRARQGSTRSPQWTHGGVALGPKPRTYKTDLNKKVKRLALKGALSSKLSADEIIVVDAIAIKDKKEPEKEVVRLQYIGNGLVQTPEIAVLQAEKETASFGVFVQDMFAKVRQLLDEKSDSKFTELFAIIENKEDVSDQIEIEIAKYIEQVSFDHLSDETKVKIRQMMREISELESVGDSCYNIARTLRRKLESGKNFTSWQTKSIHQMMQLCSDALAQMNLVMTGHRAEHDINESFRIENEIDAMRRQLKNENIRNVNDQKYDYAMGTLFSDLVTDCEKLGDYVINVVEARFGKQ